MLSRKWGTKLGKICGLTKKKKLKMLWALVDMGKFVTAKKVNRSEKQNADVLLL